MPINGPHFSDEEWADYVRDVLPGDKQADVQSHLDAGCSSCTKLHATWRAVHDAAENATDEAPAADSVRIAKALFSVHGPAAGRASVSDTVARLLFDSHSTLAASGVRSAASAAARKCVYAVGKYLLDVQIQDDEHGRPTQLIGQLNAPPAMEAQLEGSPVLLLREMKVIGRSTMNRLGEFHIDFDGVATGISLALGFTGGGTVVNLDMTRNEQ
jgi:hypothetical protein